MSRAAFVRAIGRTFPGVKQATENVLDPKASLNELRSQIWNLRTEFWLRKITTYPQVYQAAKGEARDFAKMLRRPADLTYRNVAEGGIIALQLFGCFCIGEMVGRRNVVGYDVGPKSGH